MSRIQALQAALVCVCAFAASGAQAAKYSVVDQGVEVGADTHLSGFRVALNSAGVVAVTAQARAKKIDHGVVTDLGALSVYGSYAHAIDDAGTVSGLTFDSSGWPRGFTWSNGVMTSVGVAPGYVESGIDSASAGGHCAGTSWGDLPSMLPRLILVSQGQLHDLGLPATGYVIQAGGINATDEITGAISAANGDERHAFIYRNGAFKDLGTLSHAASGSNESWGYAINDRGVVAGYSTIGDGSAYHAVTYWKGSTHDLGTLDAGPAASSFAYGINARGTVVGMSEPDGSGEQMSAFVLFKVQGRMLDLNQLLVPKDSDWHLLAAYAINDAGQIAGIGTRAGVGGVRVFLATPQQ